MTTTTTTTAAAVSYERISRFRFTGNGLDTDVERGVVRQANDAEKWGELAGVPVVRHITDENQSASVFRSKERTGWPTLLDAIRSGVYTHVAVWLLDRAVRDTDDLSELLGACRSGGAVIVQTGTGSTIDPNNPESVLHAKISGAVAEYEAAKMSMRARRRKEADAEAGRPHGGRRRFGYEQGLTAIRESEAVEVRRIVKGLLAGESLHALAADLNARGIPTPTTAERAAKGLPPAPWTGPNLRQLVARPYLAGLRVHHGAVIGHGDWADRRIITEDDHRRIVALLSDPRRRTSPESNARRHLLSGLALCGTCGAKLRTGPGVYRCPTGRHVHRSTDKIEAVVEAAMVARLSMGTMAALFADTSKADDLRRLEAAKAANDLATAEALELRRDGHLTVKAYAALTTDLEREADAITAELAALTVDANRSADILDGATGDRAAEAWASYDLGRRRAIIDHLAVVRVVSPGRGVRFTVSDVVIDWRKP